MKINVAIDRLVLDGLDVAAADRPHLRAAVEAELARLIASGGIDVSSGGAVPSVPAPPIGVSSSPKNLGRAIAGSVYGGIGRKS